MRADTPEAMVAVGERLGKLLRPGDVVTLTGGLGAGKTTLARGILRALGHVDEVPSPSFAIVQPYEAPMVRLPLAHVDLYRLDTADEVHELGLDEWLYDGALIVEWPDRLPDRLRAGALDLTILALEDGGRILTAAVPPAWEGRWPLT